VESLEDRRSPKHDSKREVFLGPWEEAVGILTSDEIAFGYSFLTLVIGVEEVIVKAFFNELQYDESILKKLLGRKVAILKTDNSFRMREMRTKGVNDL
jgi:hypothetical protein